MEYILLNDKSNIPNMTIDDTAPLVDDEEHLVNRVRNDKQNNKQGLWIKIILIILAVILTLSFGLNVILILLHHDSSSVNLNSSSTPMLPQQLENSSSTPMLPQQLENSSSTPMLPQRMENSSICNSTGTFQKLVFAENSLELMDQSLNRAFDPCHDFYAYACDKNMNMQSKWIPMEREVYEVVGDYLLSLLTDEEMAAKTKVPLSLKNARLFYQQCMLEKHRNSLLCFSEAKHLFEYPLAHAVMDNFQLWPLSDKMVKNVKHGLAQLIESSNSISQAGKKSFLKRLNEIQVEVGMPKDFSDEKFVEKLFGEKQEKSQSYDEMNEQFGPFAIDDKFEQMTGKYPKKWGGFFNPMDSFMLNAMLDDKTVILPALILFYSNIHWVDAINYGTLGMVIGHEFSHNYGPRVLKEWFNDQNQSELVKTHQCLFNQTGIKESIGDDWSDNSGLKAAFRALANTIGQGEMAKRPNDNVQLTNQQIFFISYAHSLCHKYSLVETWYGIDQYHSINSVRVTNPLKNLVEFSNAFNCPSGSPMNPVEKCEIWQ